MDVLQPHAHGAHGNGKVLEAGEQVEQVMGGQGQLCGLDALRRQLQCAKGQGCGQGRRSRGESPSGPGRARGGDMSRWLTIPGRLASQLDSIGKSLFMSANETSEILTRQKFFCQYTVISPAD